MPKLKKFIQIQSFQARIEFDETRSETRFAGLFARLPVRLVIQRRSPTSMKRDHTSGNLWGT